MSIQASVNESSCCGGATEVDIEESACCSNRKNNERSTDLKSGCGTENMGAGCCSGESDQVLCTDSKLCDDKLEVETVPAPTDCDSEENTGNDDGKFLIIFPK
jgi:hypothetical protein